VTHKPAQVFVVDEPGVRTAALSGSLDVFGAGVLAARVLSGLPAGATKLVVDLSELLSVDSGGVSALTRLRDQARARALDFHAHLGSHPRLSPTALRVLCRVLPCDDGDEIYLSVSSPASATRSPVAAER